MTSATVLQVFLTIVPALIVGVVAYYFFHNYVRDQESRRRYELMKETRKEVLPYRIQALERMALYLERINPSKLVIRVKPNGEDKYQYETKLVQSVEQEFEHNLAQQIYLSVECWDAIRTTKNATISLIRKANMDDNVSDANKLREAILSKVIDEASPSETGLAYIKKEAREIF